MPALAQDLPNYFAYDDGRLSAPAWTRLARMAADIHFDNDVRVFLLRTFDAARVERPLVERIAGTPSDPAQFIAATLVVSTMSDFERAPLVKDPANPMHAAACISTESPGPEVYRALCHIALDHDASSAAREMAVYCVANGAGRGDGGCLACVRELLEPQNSF